jgi:hypothetical protein
MDEAELQDLISLLLKNEIQNQLKLIRPARGFNGERKPVSSKYPTPLGNKLDTGDLYNATDVYFEVEGNGNQVIVVDFAPYPYWYWVNEGRRPGKYPPLSTMLSWVQSKPALTSPDLSIKQRAFLAGRSIAKYGIFQTSFIQKGFKEAEQKIEYYLGEYAKEYLTNYMIKNKIIVKG